MATALSQNYAEQKIFENKYSASPAGILKYVEMRLFKVFEDEIKSENSVITDYRPRTVHKLAQFITGEINRPVSVGIAGETASGKSSITADIIDTINAFSKKHGLDDMITGVNTDDYYYDRSKEVKQAGGIAEFARNYDFDVPEALELDLMHCHIKELLKGRPVMLPKYDMSGTAVRRDNYTLAEPSKIIISEGLFALTEKIRDAFDFKIYIDIDSEVQKKRFFIRAGERNLGSSAGSIYLNALEKAKYYIRPCRFCADIVLTGEAPRAGYKLFINKILGVIEDINF